MYSFFSGRYVRKLTFAFSHLLIVLSDTGRRVSWLVLFRYKNWDSLAVELDKFLKSSSFQGECLNHAWRSNANPSTSWYKLLLTPLWKALWTIWIGQFTNKSKPLYSTLLSLVSNKRHILQLILSPSGGRFAKNFHLRGYFSLFMQPWNWKQNPLQLRPQKRKKRKRLSIL